MPILMPLVSLSRTIYKVATEIDFCFPLLPVEPTVAAPRNLPKSSSTTLHTPLRGDHGAIGGSELLQEVTNQLSNTNRTAGGPKRARTKSMDTLSVVERPEKKQMIEKVKLEEVEEMGILVKAERAVEEVAALDKLEKVMKETKPPGWPAALSTVALSSSGVSFVSSTSSPRIATNV